MSLFEESLPIGRQRATKLGRDIERVGLLILILIFIAVAMDRIWRLRIEAERVNLMHTEAAIQVALGALVMEKTLSRQIEQIVALDGANPIGLLARPPSNYLGELSTDDGSKVDGYHWYFDTDRRQLIYVVGNPDQFSTASPEPDRAAFRLVVRYQDTDRNGFFEPARDYLTDIRFAPVTPFEWKRQP